MNPIYQKEWFKLKWYLLALVFFTLILGSYFWFDIAGQYANIEPESMMWYRFSHLNDKPYSWLLYCFIIIAAIISACQFIPEAMGKKVRILAHLPVSLDGIIFRHLVAGIAIIITANTILTFEVFLVFNHFYPIDIVHVALKDMLFGQLPAIATYLGLAAVIIESDWRRKTIKFVIAALAAYVMLKEQYQLFDILWLFVLIWLLLPIKDSFLSIKTRRIQSLLYIVSIPVLGALLLSVSTTRLYNEYAVSHNKYYIFYSPLINDFVFQENGPNHSFFYGTPSSTLDKTQFEESLPFVYWKNLDIQGKLPVKVGNKSYNKGEIRNARLSMQYNPDKLIKPEVALYPFFNPISNKGSIRFPENAISLKSNRFEVYNAETARPNSELAAEVNQLADKANLNFPISSVWGKTTNMKPFDWGYFLKDNSGKLYNLNRADNKVYLKSVPVPEDIGDIVHIQVSENRHQKFYGYAINHLSKVYLISFPDYQFIPLQLDGFDYESMSFHMLADPLYYVVRFDDGKHYSAVLFDKNYSKIARTTLK